MDRNTAVTMAQQANKAKNKRLVDQVWQLKAERAQNPKKRKGTEALNRRH